jgi:GNAT superfamily N-acetyltransferase
MGAQEPQVSLPGDAVWVELTDELLASEEGGRWRGLVDVFKPEQRHRQGREMADWLRECVHEGGVPAMTRVVHNDEILGFFAAETVRYLVSDRPLPLHAVSRRLGIGSEGSVETGLLLSSIVRSQGAGKGFGRFLIEEAVGLALELKSEKITSILVEPANPRLRRMWQETYHFAPLVRPQYLHLPLKVWEELRDL